MARRSGEVRYFVRERTDAGTCLAVVGGTAAPGAHPVHRRVERLRARGGLGVGHGTVRHGRDEAGRREWARDDDGDGIREVHCNTCEGAGAGLRTFLRMFRGVHKFYLAEYVACYETMTNAKRITPDVLRRMCLLPKQAQTNYT